MLHKKAAPRNLLTINILITIKLVYMLTLFPVSHCSVQRINLNQVQAGQAFTQPIDPRYLNKVVDNSYGMERVEVRSRFGDSHLGHVFYDGPKPTHLRYCMDSAAMNFIPKDEMKAEGYGKYLWLVD